MASKKDMKKMNAMVAEIKKSKSIDRIQLVMRTGISVSTYDKLRPYMAEIFKHSVAYDATEKTWRSLV